MPNVPILVVAALLALVIPIAYVVGRSWSRGTPIDVAVLARS